MVEILEDRLAPATFTVINTNDSGPGSLRQAILDANGDTNTPHLIQFNIPVTDPGHFYYQNDGVAGQVSRDNIAVTTTSDPSQIPDIDPDHPFTWFSIQVGPGSGLPTISRPVIIDGYTQPGASANTNPVGQGLNTVLKIELTRTGAWTGSGLSLSTGSGDSTVRGLVLNQFSSVGITTGGSSPNGNHRIEGNFLGTDVSGTLALGNSLDGVHLFGDANNTIGGTTPAARNLISGNTRYGILFHSTASTTGHIVQGNIIGLDVTGTQALGNGQDGIFLRGVNSQIGGSDADDGAQDGVVHARNVISGNGGAGIFFDATGNSREHVIQGNFIGTDVTGTQAVPNLHATAAVYLTSSGAAPINNLIGGSAPGAGNLISGNVGWGIGLTVGATGNVIQGNFIGTQADGISPLPNEGIGIALFVAGHISTPPRDNLIGGTEPGEGNIIAFNGHRGVSVSGNGTVRNAILGNSIHSNAQLGIDLFGVAGPDPNDPLDADTGANNLQNYPVLTDVVSTPGFVTITGTLHSYADSRFRIEFFGNRQADPSGFGEGETFLGFTEVTTDGDGNAAFDNITLPAVIAQTRFVTATATRLEGIDETPTDTSEFSEAFEVFNPLVVTTTLDVVDPDDGLTSLREAIIFANASPGLDTISFNIPHLPGLISHYSAQGNANDSVGSNHGTLVNGATFAPGHVGQAFSFDGEDDHVRIPFDVSLASDQFSVSAWVQPISLSDDPLVASQKVIFGQSSGRAQLVIRPGITGAIVQFQFLASNQSDFPAVISNTEIPLGEFSHVAGTFDGTTLRIYINGVLDNQATTALSPFASVDDFFIGGFAPTMQSPSPQAFHGLIDEVGYYGRALTDSEVATFAAGPWTIHLNSALPAITAPVIIDGYSQPGASPNTLAHGWDAAVLIEIDFGGFTGLTVTSDGGGSTIQGLSLYNSTFAGVWLDGSNDNVVRGNLIGLRANSSDPGTGLRNSGDGVQLSDGASDNTIGGTTPAARNVIAFNGETGVRPIEGGTGVTILGNSIFDNGGLGIDLGGDGVTPNDPGDADTGDNNLQNFPEVTLAATTGSATTIDGTLHSTANTTFRVEFFANDQADPSGFGEGQIFFGFTNVTTDSNGDGDFSITLPVGTVAGQFITATATDPGGNTSEFSQALIVTLDDTEVVELVGLAEGNLLVYFDSNDPETITAQVPITGLQADEIIVGIDVRVADDGLFGVSNFNRVFQINAATGQTTFQADLTIGFNDGLAAGFDETLGLYVDAGGLFEDYAGAGVKWLRGEANQFGNVWYFLRPNGEFVAWNGGAGASGEVLANFGTNFFINPELLYNASQAVLPTDQANQARALDEQLGLYVDAGGLYEDWKGLGVKWLRGETHADGNPWYFIRRTGEFVAWDRGPGAAGTVLFQFDPLLFLNPELLFNASQAALPTDQANQAQILDEQLGLHVDAGGFFEDYAGAGVKWLRGEANQSGNVWYFIRPNGEFVAWNGSAGADGEVLFPFDPLLFLDPQLLFNASDAALPTGQAELAETLDEQLGLYVDARGFFQDYFGDNEKWLRGKVNSFGNVWYFLLPDGRFFEWSGVPLSLTGNLLGSFDPLLHRTPELLFDAFQPPQSQHTSASFGVDIDPVSGEMRVVTESNLNLRFDLATGYAVLDGDLSFGTVVNFSIAALAYDNNVAGAITTMLFAIDTERNFLMRIDPANAGAMSAVGNLGVDTSNIAGLEIANADRAFAALAVEGQSRLYSINLNSGAATLLGSIGSFNSITSLAALTPALVDAVFGTPPV